MYNPQKPWESEHAGYFNSKKEKQYHKEDKAGYNSGGNPLSEYNKDTASLKDDDSASKKDEWLDSNEKKDAKITDEEIPFKAARQIFSENKREEKKDDPGKKKNLNSIEDAIKKAIEDEKKVIMMD